MKTSPWLDSKKIRMLHLFVGVVLCAVALLSLHDLAQTLALLTLALGVATLLRGLSFITLYVQAQENHLPRTLLLALTGTLLSLGGLILIGVALGPDSATTVPLHLWLLRVVAVLILLDAAGTLMLTARCRPTSTLGLIRGGLALVLLILGTSLLLFSFTRPDALAVPLALTLVLQGVQHILAGLLLRRS